MIDQIAIRVFRSETILRRTAVDLARFACNGDLGRCAGDSVFDLVTSARGHSAYYSASGDLPHFVLKMLGVRDPRLVSLDQGDRAGAPWTLGRSVPRIVFPKTGMFVWARPGLRPKPGDILYTAAPEHVSILEELDERTGDAAIFAYGRQERRRLRPAGFWEMRRLVCRGSVLYLDKSRLRGWFDLTRIPGLLVRDERPLSDELSTAGKRVGPPSEMPAGALSQRLVQEMRRKGVQLRDGTFAREQDQPVPMSIKALATRPRG